ncbi:type II toxin-antitoxin system HicB family antitoxin [Selenomonas sp. AB3002]
MDNRQAIASKSGSNNGVYFADFPGCIATGATLDEALYLAKEGLAMHI